MLNHTPDAIELVDYIDDGEKARHYQFRLRNITSQATTYDWQSAQPGQFFMLNVPSIGEAAFTFTEPPNEQGEFRALIRQMGKLTHTLFTLPKGEILGARGPFGHGWPLEEIIGKNIIIIAGGCGLAPLVNLINGLIDNLADDQRVVLVYGAQSKRAQLLSPERERWQAHIKIYNTLNEIKDQYTLAENESQGTPLDIIDTAMYAFTKPPATALLCGPEIMMYRAAKQLVNKGMTNDAIFLAIERRMHCAVGLCGHCYLHEHYVCKKGPTFSWQELQSLV
ncbi:MULTISPECIES: iron-sulfur cluster-binding protein [unclassified Colwellia]|uniref:iron-sulfur cluster-binding protein n=1 Tax=unclassified Colwellia TaxID=196834 RepID=UPI0015F5DF01|nr:MULTISPECIES: FAD-binding oxidoreductase [unclassified Colwellia]MBA6234024.1 oxidoreductase [Colwellia sp. MB02u-7]MBA6238054.1 oxidoreductase [Colwellia sp. MB02u-11]MBA6300698.1 oxidoreductase [Colwellia sp. MB3u-22]MBA6311403.1 oxidoreductase [Colwellia sp. MB3u-64]